MFCSVLQHFTSEISDSRLVRAVETAVRVTQIPGHEGDQGDQEEDQEEEQQETKFGMFMCNSITRAVMQ